VSSSRRPHREGEHILLVEVANRGDLDGLSVIRLGPHGELAKEWDAWHTCRPHGLRHDIVLMDLRRVPDAGDPIAALAYADAEQLIGVDALAGESLRAAAFCNRNCWRDSNRA
jgi:hypothetical protein